MLGGRRARTREGHGAIGDNEDAMEGGAILLPDHVPVKHCGRACCVLPPLPAVSVTNQWTGPVEIATPLQAVAWLRMRSPKHC